MCHRQTSTTCRSDGFILIAVLWILGVLSAFASIYAVFVLNTAAGLSIYDGRLRAQELAAAAIELVAQRTLADAKHPSVGRFDLRLGGATAAVDFSSEAGRIDLNAAPKEVLAGLFVALGAPREQAEFYAERVVAWRSAPSKGDDPEADAYRHANLGFGPRGAPFPHALELSLVRALPADLVERALPFVTVYSGRAQVNVEAAAPEVLAALPQMTPVRLQAVLAQRQLPNYDRQALLALLGPARSHASLEAGRTFRVRIKTLFGNGFQAAFEIVVLVFEEGREPLAVLSWRSEDDDLSVGPAASVR